MRNLAVWLKLKAILSPDMTKWWATSDEDGHYESIISI